MVAVQKPNNFNIFLDLYASNFITYINISIMTKQVVIFEAPGGKDKGADGHRKDSQPIADAINKH